MVCVIVPFRVQPQFDRESQLRRLLRALRGSGCSVLVVQQSEDGELFNRGKLLNIGFALRPRGESTCIFHDVDLLPCSLLLRNYKDGTDVLHMGSRWDRYATSRDSRYLGGVLRMSAADFESINGFPNSFWGWGGEDDALRARTEARGLPVAVPREGRYEDMERLSLRGKLDMLKRDRLKCMTKWECLDRDAREWQQDGLSSLDFHVLCSEHHPDGCMRYTVDLRYPPVRRGVFFTNHKRKDGKRKRRHEGHD